MKMLRLAQFLFYSVIILGVYFIFADFARLKLNTADASTYLNIAENIAAHKGFVVTFDLYQFFTAHEHPLWPFLHPVYPLLCALVFILHGGIEQVIRLNIFILGINAALVFYLISRYCPSRLNLLFLFCLVFSFNFFYTSIFPWTEQLHLMFFLITFILFLRFPDRLAGLLSVGALNGFLFLIRVSHVYSLPAYLLVLGLSGGEFRERLRNVLVFLAGFLAVLGPYQLFNWLVFHSLYPEYLKPAADYTLARVSHLSGYRPGHAGMYNPSGFQFAMSHIGYFCNHVKGLCGSFVFFLIPVAAYLSLLRHKAQGSFFVLNCLCQSACIVLGYSYSFSWNPNLETLRYSLIPFVLIMLAGWFCFYELFFIAGSGPRRMFVVAILTILVFFSGARYLDLRQQLIGHPRTEDPYYIDLYGSFRWVDGNLPPNILVASNEDQEGYFMHRPFISMPPKSSFSCANLRIYDRIYAPDYYLLSLAVPGVCFDQIPHKQVFSNKTFRILKVKRN